MGTTTAQERQNVHFRLMCVAQKLLYLSSLICSNAEETSSEDEDELPHEGHGLKDVWERDEKKESWDEDEDENEDEDSNEDEHEQEGDDDDDDDEDEDANEDADEHAHEGDEDRDEMKRTSALLLQG